MVVELALTGVVFAVHTLIAAVMTRYFRIRMHTRWGSVVYTLLLVPLALLVTTLVFTGVLGIGVSLGDPTTALAVMVAMPLALGFTIDVLYVPAPEEYDLPDTR
jgi:hypothetical protein